MASMMESFANSHTNHHNSVGILKSHTLRRMNSLNHIPLFYHSQLHQVYKSAIKMARDSWFAKKFGAVVICDVSDAVGAGAPGENTWILKALIGEGADLVSYIPVRDVEAAREAFKIPLNQTITLTVGGKLDKTYNRPLEVTGQVIHKTEWLYGKTVILKNKGVHLILTEMPVPAMHPDFYTDLGLNLWEADVVVVKNLFPFRIWFLLYNRKTINIATPGTTNINVFDLKYQNITRPIYPLDKVDSWRW